MGHKCQHNAKYLMQLKECEYLRTKKNDKSYGLQHANITLSDISENVRLRVSEKPLFHKATRTLAKTVRKISELWK